MSRINRSIQNFASGLVLLGVSIVIGFFTTPMLIKYLGEEAFGAVKALGDCYGYLALFDLGLENSVMTFLVRAVNKPDDRGGVARVVAAATRASLGVMGVSILVGLALIVIIPKLVPVSVTQIFNLRVAAGLATVSYLLQPLSVLRNLCEAKQQSYIVNLFLLGQTLLMACLSLLFAYLDLSIAGQLLSGLLGTTVFYVLIFWKVVRRDRSIAVADFFARVDQHAWRELWTMNWPNFGLNLFGRVSLMSDNLIVGYLIGPAAVVPFFITSRLPQICQRVLQNIGNASWAALGHIHTEGDHEKFSKSLIELTSIVAILGVAALAPIALANKAFVTLWVGPSHFYGTYATIVAAAAAYIISLVSLWGWSFLATGRIRDLLPMYAVQTAFNLALSIAFTKWFGVIGTLLGTSVAQAITSLWWLPRLIAQTFGTSMRQLSLAWIKPLLVGAPYCMGLHLIFEQLTLDSWLSVVASMIAAGSGYLALAYAVILTTEERREWRQRAMRFVRR